MKYTLKLKPIKYTTIVMEKICLKQKMPCWTDLQCSVSVQSLWLLIILFISKYFVENIESTLCFRTNVSSELHLLPCIFSRSHSLWNHYFCQKSRLVVLGWTTYHPVVQQFCSGKVFLWYFQFRAKIENFLLEKNDHLTLFLNTTWLWKWAFAEELIKSLNEFSIKLQSKIVFIIQIYSYKENSASMKNIKNWYLNQK